MNKKSLELLELLLDATRTQQMVWLRDSQTFYRSEFANLPCSFRFRHPLLAGDDGSDADAVEVSVGQTGLTFYSGTEGFDLVGEILAAGFPELREHHQNCSSRLHETVEKIRQYAGS